MLPNVSFLVWVTHLYDLKEARLRHAYLVAQSVKNTLVMQVDPGLIPALGRFPIEKMATDSSILPGKSHEQRSLMGYSRWGHEESDTTEWLNHQHHQAKAAQVTFNEVGVMWFLHPFTFLTIYWRVVCHVLLQRIFLTLGSNLGLLHCGQMLYRLSHQGIPWNI